MLGCYDQPEWRDLPKGVNQFVRQGTIGYTLGIADILKCAKNVRFNFRFF
jgi:hypothetical protein